MSLSLLFLLSRHLSVHIKVACDFVPIFDCKVTFKDHLELLGRGEFISLVLRINFTLNVFQTRQLTERSCSSRKAMAHTSESANDVSTIQAFFLVLLYNPSSQSKIPLAKCSRKEYITSKDCTFFSKIGMKSRQKINGILFL